MSTKFELEQQIKELKEELKKSKDRDKEIIAMVSLWAVKLESVERSADHPFDIIKEVFKSMKAYIGV